MTKPDFIAEAKARFETAKTAWSKIREDYNTDARAVHIRGGQWNKKLAAERKEAGLPTLEFNELHTYTQQITNRARQERPQPKITAGDGGDPQTAEMLEGKIRHIQYASQADVAYDCAVECAASGGWGVYRITREYIADKSFHQEPRVRRILDPTTVYFDPAAQEPDYSDADWCFVRKRMKRDDFQREYKVEPVPFDANDSSWGDEENVWVAEYWHVDKQERVLVQTAAGELAFKDELSEEEAKSVLAERPVTERTVFKDIIDGSRTLETEEWPGAWIPLIPVLGGEAIVEGEYVLKSAVRFALDASKLKNATQSGIAEVLGSAALNFPWVGYKGQFKSESWRDGKRHVYLEAEPTLINGQPAPLPERNAVEPPIQALTSASLQYTDDIKRAVGYVDNITRPSQADISGVAVSKREQQSDLTNFHFEDNLVRSQWHAGRVMLDLYLNLTDTPRLTKVMAEDQTVSDVPVTMAGEDGTAPSVQGHENKQHHRIDIGNYDVAFRTGPTYAVKKDEERDVLIKTTQQNPQLGPMFLDLIFERMGYPELAERARFLLPQQVQQALAAKQQGQQIPPQVQAQLAQLSQQNQQLMAVVQKVMTMLQTKQIEAKGKLDLEKLKLIGELMVEQAKQGHDMAKHHLSEHTDAIEHMLTMLHDSELAPDPNAMAAQPKGKLQ